jgi:hypothetical protein
MKTKPTISEIFNILKNENSYKPYIKKRIIKIILGSSVIRALPPKSKPSLMTCLDSIALKQLHEVNSQETFDIWHKKQVSKVEACLVKCNAKSQRFEKDEQLFGHAIKVLNLFMGHLVLNSEYFSQEVKARTKYLLHVPLDSKVFSALKNEPGLNVPKYIKSLTPGTYQAIQKKIREFATKANLPSIYLDDYAWAGDQE